ncbi:hypothetical protein Si081_00001 [Streptococcus infantarius subsp. infantarius]|nr:hypothetical protein [Streptococcus infantarius subsp. infantarius]MCO4574053.1 hypothetical protein [Streptococcus infantarius subsp. infantarius]
MPEGGEGFKYWYNYFSSTMPSNIFKQKFPTKSLGQDIYRKMYPNYIEYFQGLMTRKPNYLTIFLFDNEPAESPLYKFVNHASELQIDKNTLDQIREKNFYKISKKNSLYVMATPLLNKGNSSDIEDLLLARNQPPVLNGKIFSKSGGSNYYGKDVLSKYVLKNFKKFDFTEFIPLLDGIRDNILDYRKN